MEDIMDRCMEAMGSMMDGGMMGMDGGLVERPAARWPALAALVGTGRSHARCPGYLGLQKVQARLYPGLVTIEIGPGPLYFGPARKPVAVTLGDQRPSHG
ncbi:MAG: hypothetical protein M3518_04015 [Actinomycetota bacterium]|jgi:hypothetical protein|nr:hypothetical protein [Actinomycetota bacterium]